MIVHRDSILFARQGQDSVRPFYLENGHVSGRAVRLERVVNDIILQHAYPDCINRFLAELIAMASVLYGTFKVEGIITLQIKGSHLVNLLVCDINHHGHIRAYAQFNEQALAQMSEEEQRHLTLREALGEGYLLFVIDPEHYSERYQGVVALIGATLAESLEHYFAQSAQYDIALYFAVRAPLLEKEDGWRRAQHPEKYGWRCGAVMLQRLPTTSETADLQTEDWEQAKMLLATITPEELIEGEISVDELLYRLFHEIGVRVHEVAPLVAKCRCSREKVNAVLGQLVQELDTEEPLEITCEFCGKHYFFDPRGGNQ